MSPALRVAARVARGLAMAFVALAVGCSTAPPALHRDGMAQVESGRYEQGLSLLEEAARADANNAAARMMLYAGRERAVSGLLADAHKAMAAGQVADARAACARALAIAPNDARIAQVLRELSEREARSDNARRPVAEEAADPPQLRSRLNNPVTLEFRDANIKMVFDVLSRASGINFILDKEIKGDVKVTIYVRDVAVEDAIDLALVQSQLEKKILSDNTVLIYPNTPQKVREYQELIIRSFYLVNADAKQTATTLKTILKVKDMQVDDRLNMIMLRDTPDTVRLAEKIVRVQDLAEPEVTLEIEVLEINRTRALELGVTWPDTFTWILPADATIGQLPFTQHVTRDRIGINSSVVLTAKESYGIANLISNPRIRVKNRDKARVLVGDRVPIITATVTPGAVNPITTETITYLDVGLKLETEPTVLPDDEVSIKLALEVSTLGDSVKTQNGSVAYRVGTRNVSTSLRLKDGETQVLMGLIRDDERKSANGVPGVMNLPVLGRLFSTPNGQVEKTEIALALTPRIVRNFRAPLQAESEFWSGTEANMRSRRPVLTSTAASAAAARTLPDAPRADLPPAPSPLAPPVPSPGTPAVPPVPAPNTPSATPVPSPNLPAVPPPGPSSALEPLRLGWVAPEGARVGDEFVVALEADAPAALAGVALTLRYDPVALEVVKVEEGELLRKDSARTRFSHSVDSARGRIAIGISRATSGKAGGRGRLFNVTFRATAPSAASRILLTSVSPRDADDAALAFTVGAPVVVALKP